jgi:hypothetical protein
LPLRCLCPNELCKPHPPGPIVPRGTIQVRSRWKRTAAIVPRGTFGDSRGWRGHCSTWNNRPPSTSSCGRSTWNIGSRTGLKFLLDSLLRHSARVGELARARHCSTWNIRGDHPAGCHCSTWNIRGWEPGVCHCSTWNNPRGEVPQGTSQADVPRGTHFSAQGASHFLVVSYGVFRYQRAGPGAIVPRGTFGGAAPERLPLFHVEQSGEREGHPSTRQADVPRGTFLGE